MLDLHNHTTYSDGMLTPQELVEKAIASGVRALGITDHDTVGGWQEAQKAAEGTELEIVPGIELSTVYNGRSLHILGYYPDAEKLIPPLQERLAGRYRRAAEMVEKLAELGYPIELPEMGGEMAPGRPHVARALVEAGYVKSSQAAFDKWIGEGKPAYVQYEKFSAEDGIKLLRECSAVPVWAHPHLFRGGVVEEVLPALVEAGLLGIEVDHPCHSVKQRLKLGQLAQEYGLLRTGGSDYHGGEGDHLNRLGLSLELLLPLQERALQL